MGFPQKLVGQGRGSKTIPASCHNLENKRCADNMLVKTAEPKLAETPQKSKDLSKTEKPRVARVGSRRWGARAASRCGNARCLPAVRLNHWRASDVCIAFGSKHMRAPCRTRRSPKPGLRQVSDHRLQVVLGQFAPLAGRAQTTDDGQGRYLFPRSTGLMILLAAGAG